MGIPTPTYYDQLLLTKCKLLLQAALANPKRKGGSYSWEEFVTGLDERDEGTIRTFEVLLQETAVRRPRKTTTNEADSNSRRRPRTVNPVSTRLRQHFEQTTGIALGESDTSDSSDSDSEGPRFEVSREVDRLLGIPDRPVGIPIDRTITTTTTSSSGGGITRQDPSQRLRDHERGSLFGFDEPAPSFSELLNNIAAVANENETDFLSRRTTDVLNQSSQPHISPVIPRATTTSTSSSSSYSELPTFQELWEVLNENNEEQEGGGGSLRFPSESINSFDSFLNRLNSTSSISSTNPLTSRDMNGLLAELTLRDVSIPIRVRNVISRRRGQPPSSVRRRTTPSQQQVRSREGREEESPLMEGIWRIRAGPPPESSSFSEFARRRRAFTREREEEGAVPPPIANSSSSSSTISNSNNETPVTSTTPATSQAPSPVSTCPLPPPTVTSDRPLTSADRAIAAIRQQREIAPLRSSTSTTTTTTGGTNESRNNDNRGNGGDDLSARMNWIDSVIERGRRFLAEDEAMYGPTPSDGTVPQNEDARQAIERIRALTSSRSRNDGN
ncbi:hypothetical protein JCM5350_006571 [Sporobolomyces pararoseus]